MTFHLEFTALLYTGRVLPMVSYVGLTLLAFFVLTHNPRSTTNRIFFLLALSEALWNIALYLVLGAQNPQTALEYWKLYGLSVLLLVPTWTYFALHFAGRRVKPILVYAPSLIFLPILLFTNHIYSGVTPVSHYYAAQSGGPLFLVYILYILFYILYGIAELLRVYTAATALDRRRIKWMVLGSGVVVAAAVVDIMLRLSGNLALPLSPATSIIMVMAIGYSFVIDEGEL